MLILGIDTTGRSLSVALLSGETLLGEITIGAVRGQAGLAMDSISRLFEVAGLNPAQLDGVAVTNGPGGFTGVRLGVSLAKGLCLGLEKPVAAVSSLQALAFQALAPGFTTWAVLDCLKNEVYAASYSQCPDGPVETSQASVMKPEELAERMSGPCLIVGDGALRHEGLLTAGGLARLAPRPCHVIRAATVAMLGSRLLPEAKIDSADSLLPFYLRGSDARLPAKPLRCKSA